MRRFLLAAILITGMVSYAQPDSVTQRIYLIGDGGELQGDTHPVVDWVGKNVNWNDERNTAIFLGDNIYPLGLGQRGEADYAEGKKIIDHELRPFLNKKGRAFFIMGNHDWKNGKLGGWQRARNQYDYINGLGMDNIRALPGDGCPGPVAVDLNNQVVVIFVDSQWFLYIHDKPGPGSTCAARTVEEFQTELGELIAQHPNQMVLVVTHHPIYTFGVHGGDYTWKEHLFPLTAANPKLWIPLPIIGSIYPITRGIFGNLQDVNHPYYKNMARIIEEELKRHPNAMAAAGHDHSLQFIQRDSVHYIVSGSASLHSRVQENRKGQLLFSDLENGLAMIEISKSGTVKTNFYNIRSANVQTPTYTKSMKTIYAAPTVVSKDTIPDFPDSVSIAANPKLKENFWRRFFIGRNYRKEWTTPIRVPVLDLGTESGGLTPEKQGGGKQTRSLRVKDKSGKEWNLRSVVKYPDAAIPADLRQTFVKDLVSDGISASYPYGGLSIEPMSRAAGVPFLRKRLVFIPDDPRLGRFRQEFRNTMAIMEERQPDTLRKTDNTDEVSLKLAKDNDDHVDQMRVLRARLLDNFYMDLDRHEGQWEWSTYDTGKGKVYYPIPKDQDQAFFVNEGIIPYFVRKPWISPELQGFDAKAHNIKTFNRPARNFDRFFLNELTREQWSQAIDEFLPKMTDEVIEQALNRQPKEIRGISYKEITDKLKNRRKYFKEDMMEYYDFLSKEVNVVGTNQRELIVINKLPENKVQVTMNKIDKSGVVSSKIYDRTFDESTTKQLMIYGLDGRDSFIVRGEHSGIKIRVIGGPGDDHFANESMDGKPIRVYDVDFEDNKFSGNESIWMKRVNGNPRNNEYNQKEYKYGYFNPGIQYGYNVDDGVFLGVKGEVITQGFRKEPYSTRHVFRVAHSLRNKSYYFGYDADFVRTFGNNDLLIRSDVRAPVNVSNFFGLGNNTEYDRNKPGRDRFYRARYQLSNVAVLLRKQLQSWMRINYGIAFQAFDINRSENDDKFLGSSPLALAGLNAATLYNPKYYAGPQFLIDINSKNNQQLPTRGFTLNAGAKTLFGLTEESNTLTQLHWDMSLFISTKNNPRVVYAFRFGVGHNIGAFEIPQAQYLNGMENLRGFRRNRFAGRSMLFNNAEVRVRLANFSTFLFPGSLGIIGFHDVGRVWQPGDANLGRWHNGYGGGIYIAPISRWVAAFSVATSKDKEVLPYFSLGFRF